MTTALLLAAAWAAAPEAGPPPEDPAPVDASEILIVDHADPPDEQEILILDHAGPADGGPGAGDEGEGADDEILIIDPQGDDGAPGEPAAGGPPPPWEAPPRTWFTAELASRLAVDTNFDTRTREDVVEWWSLGRLRLDYKKGDLRVFAEGWLRWGVVAEDTKPLADFYLFNAHDPKWAADLQLREGWVSFDLLGIDVTVGQRIFVWGKNELLAPADVLNPVDLRYDPLGAVVSTKDAKVPVFALDLAYPLAEGTVARVVVVPFFAANRGFLFGRDFALAAPGSAADRQLRALGAVHPSIEDELQSVVPGTEIPDESPENATVALRVTTSLGGWDLGATAAYGWDRTPRVQLDPDLRALIGHAPRIVADPQALATDPELQALALRVQQRAAVGEQLLSATYQRSLHFALEAEGVVGDVVLRADVGFSPALGYYDLDLELHRLPTLTSVVGMEYARGETWFVQLTALAMTLFDPPQRKRLLGLERRELDPSTRDATVVAGVAATGRYVWAWADLEIQAGAIVTVLPLDVVLTGAVSYTGLEPHEIQLGGVFLWGEEGTVGDAYQRNDFLFLGYRSVW